VTMPFSVGKYGNITVQRLIFLRMVTIPGRNSPRKQQACASRIWQHNNILLSGQLGFSTAPVDCATLTCYFFP